MKDKALILALIALTAFLGGWTLRPRLAGDGFGEIPRTPDGHPDLNGTWQVLNTANFDVEPHPARAALALRTDTPLAIPAKEVVALGAVGAVPAGLGVVEEGAIPYLPEARKQKEKNQRRWLQRDPEIRCYLPGIPRANYMPFPFQIFQSAKAILFAYEYAGAVRNIFLKDPGPAPMPSWMGQSVARWEGDALVVDVTGQNDQTWLDRAGNFHSPELHVVERYTALNPTTMRYEAVLEDPKVYTHPWKMSMNLYRRTGPDARLLQFKCVEFVEELLYGQLRKVPFP